MMRTRHGQSASARDNVLTLRDGEQKKKGEEKRKYEPPPPTRVGRKKKKGKGAAPAYKLPTGKDHPYPSFQGSVARQETLISHFTAFLSYPKLPLPASAVETGTR